MNDIERFFLKLYLMLSNLPHMPLGQMLMPTFFVTGWLVFTVAGAAPEMAFVASATIAVAAQIWFKMPKVFHGTSGDKSDKVFAGCTVLLMLFALIALSVWMASPTLTQRLLSGYCAVRFLMLCYTIATEDKEFLGHFFPVGDDNQISTETRKHYLKLQVLVVFLFLAVNEALILTDAPLVYRVATLACVPVLLHYFFCIAAWLTVPLDEL